MSRHCLRRSGSFWQIEYLGLRLRIWQILGWRRLGKFRLGSLLMRGYDASRALAWREIIGDRGIRIVQSFINVSLGRIMTGSRLLLFVLALLAFCSTLGALDPVTRDGTLLFQFLSSF